MHPRGVEQARDERSPRTMHTSYAESPRPTTSPIRPISHPSHASWPSSLNRAPRFSSGFSRGLPGRRSRRWGRCYSRRVAIPRDTFQTQPRLVEPAPAISWNHLAALGPRQHPLVECHAQEFTCSRLRGRSNRRRPRPRRVETVVVPEAAQLLGGDLVSPQHLWETRSSDNVLAQSALEHL
jgi:hypothetical protein